MVCKYFYFLICVFWRAKFFILIKFNLLILFLIVHTFCVIYKNSLSNPSLQRFHPMFSLSCYVCIWCKVRVEFHLFVVYPIVQAPIVERTVLSPLNYLAPFLKINWPSMWQCVTGLPILFHLAKCLLSLDYCSFAVSLKSK